MQKRHPQRVAKPAAARGSRRDAPAGRSGTKGSTKKPAQKKKPGANLADPRTGRMHVLPKTVEGFDPLGHRPVMHDRDDGAPTVAADVDDDGKERLQKALARAGVASRRAAEQMIVEGRVKVNDVVVKELGSKIDPSTDKVTVDGRFIRIVPSQASEKVYFLLNKPLGFLTTTKDDRGRRTVMDLVVGASQARIYPVGRLDYDAEGALLLTNDGELANLLTHPRYHVPKTYMAKVKGAPAEDKLDKLRRGIYLEDGPTKPAHIEVVSQAKVNTWVEITVTEGRNRLIKRMFWRIEHPVLKLVRTKFGALDTEGLKLGEYRPLTRLELQALRAILQ
jgi:23S rRNA pseudouridine2605 synthase